MRTKNFVDTGLSYMVGEGCVSMISQTHSLGGQQTAAFDRFTAGLLAQSRLDLGDERIIDRRRRKKLYRWHGVPLRFH